MLARTLLERGFLPSELPPLFFSQPLGVIVPHIAKPQLFTQQVAKWTDPVRHNIARPGGLRRTLTVPNPMNMFRIAGAFESHQAVLATEWAKSPFSLTTPDLTFSGIRAISRNSADRAVPRAKIRVGARYVLKADIAQFYPSIYTHSIPWVLHTKAVAKAQMKSMHLAGNQLDKEIQASQQGQTKGIAIGPDTSLGIAEMLLGQLDARLNSHVKIVGGCRFIDDIELTFRTLAEAGAALTELQVLLSELELQPNATKTLIQELPQRIESKYVTQLRRNIPGAFASRAQWIDFFNTAFSLAKENPADGVLRYAIACLPPVTVAPASWELVQRLLWQCITLDAGCIRFVVDMLASQKIMGGQTVSTPLAAAAIDSVISSSAAAGHASEVVWSIWAAMYLAFQISPENQAAIEDMDDAFVAGAAMFAAQTTPVFSQAILSPLWKSWLQPDCFYEDHWLFVYEALYRGWFPTELATSGLAQDPCATFLSGAGVTFINDTAVAQYQPRRMIPQPGGAGGGAYPL